MPSGNTKKTGTSQRRGKTDKTPRTPGSSRPTITATSLKERMGLVSTCEGIGAMIIGGRYDRVNAAVEALQKHSRILLLQQHLDVWLPRFEEHYAKLQQVLGPELLANSPSLVQELKEKALAAGYANLREFVIKVMLPLVSYHGLLLFLNNEAQVALPPEVRGHVIDKMNAINRALGGACAAMVMQETLGA